MITNSQKDDKLVFALAAGFCWLVAACAPPDTKVQTEFAAGNSQAAALKRVAVLPFEGSDGTEATAKFEAMLTSVTNKEGQPYFTVIDRRKLDNAFAELKLQRSGAINEKTAQRLGRMIGAEGIYTGSVATTTVLDKTFDREVSECPRQGKKVVLFCTNPEKTTVKCTARIAQYTLTPRLVDVQSGQVIYQKSIVKQQQVEFCGANDGIPKSPEVLMGSAREDAFGEARREVAPYLDTLALVLKDSHDGLRPEARERFDNSVDFAKVGRMDRACEIWTELAVENGGCLAIAYNLAVCEEAGGRLEAALVGYERADRMLGRPDKDVNAALVRVRERIADRQKLSDQMVIGETSLPAQQPTTRSKRRNR